jgi:hypothetical protein
MESVADSDAAVAGRVRYNLQQEVRLSNATLSREVEVAGRYILTQTSPAERSQ